ncbi:hypothetical protein IEQ34_000505 [Dendrobium chrysotoxum]|uniref:Uncharacterized protein n=1 Tax=Dendrobium chrysotoxum TaxID=161865 RepID=A0AAV7HQM2_DENCH|nr:hypothetical protein IEQ34_000505 [Dendrobium chrysotoxum]
MVAAHNNRASRGGSRCRARRHRRRTRRRCGNNSEAVDLSEGSLAADGEDGEGIPLDGNGMLEEWEVWWAGFCGIRVRVPSSVGIGNGKRLVAAIMLSCVPLRRFRNGSYYACERISYWCFLLSFYYGD